VNKDALSSFASRFQKLAGGGGSVSHDADAAVGGANARLEGGGTAGGGGGGGGGSSSGAGASAAYNGTAMGTPPAPSVALNSFASRFQKLAESATHTSAPAPAP
jgi:hypothetical protein